MPADTLFGHISVLLHSHPENVATEALKYILDSYPGAWDALRTLLKPTKGELPEVLHFTTQVVGEDDAIPDLVGHDIQGSHRLIIESKFWAGLTDNQPVAYLKMLPDIGCSVLAVIAPSARLETLWQKLRERITEAKISVLAVDDSRPEHRVMELAGTNEFVLTSWQAVLRHLIRDAEARGEPSLTADLLQLQGLCNRMDTEGFLPFTDQDLSPEVARHVQQLADIVDAVALELVAKYGASTKNLSTGGWQATYGRFFLWRRFGCFFFYSPDLWAKIEAPLYLTIRDSNWMESNSIAKAMARYAMPSGVRVIETSKGPAFPMPPLLHAERDEVVADLSSRVMKILEFCDSESA